MNYAVKKNPHAEHRARALGIGERLEVLKDHPASPGCTSPFAPVRITEMVRRRTDGKVARPGSRRSLYAHRGCAVPLLPYVEMKTVRMPYFGPPGGASIGWR